jgi:hypothetical protein
LRYSSSPPHSGAAITERSTILAEPQSSMNLCLKSRPGSPVRAARRVQSWRVCSKLAMIWICRSARFKWVWGADVKARVAALSLVVAAHGNCRGQRGCWADSPVAARLGVWYRSGHGLRPGCELLPELTAAGPGSPVSAGTRRHPAPTGLAHASWFRPGHDMTSPQVPAAAGAAGRHLFTAACR